MQLIVVIYLAKKTETIGLEKDVPGLSLVLDLCVLKSELYL